MKHVLMVTVGGSPEPIITAVTTLRPERVVFVCSSGRSGSESQVLGSGEPCEIRRNEEVVTRLPNLPTQLQLGDRFQADRDLILIDDPDDASECYLAISRVIRTLKAEHWQIEVDYTGGTKTMSLALGMAAVHYGLQAYVTSHQRMGLGPIQKGQFTHKAPAERIELDRLFAHVIPDFLERYDYPAAILHLTHLLSTVTLAKEDRQRVEQVLKYCRGFEAWDRFDHAEAFEFLEGYVRSSGIKPCLDFLKRVLHSRADMDDAFQFQRLPKFIRSEAYHGYEIVEDLILNADRRASRQRYDDAVGRLYRALELLMQIHLTTAYRITTAGMSRETLRTLLPEAVRPKYACLLEGNNDELKFGLRQGYDLVSDLSPDDPLGRLYRQHRRALTPALTVRHRSLFAHGFCPITKPDYDNFIAVVRPFLDTALEQLCPTVRTWPRVQFPTTLLTDNLA